MRVMIFIYDDNESGGDDGLCSCIRVVHFRGNLALVCPTHCKEIPHLFEWIVWFDSLIEQFYVEERIEQGMPASFGSMK